MLSRFFFAILFVGISIHSVSAKTVSAGAFMQQRSKSLVKKPLTDAQYFTIDAQALTKDLSGQRMQISDFPGGNGEFITLDLKPAHSAIDSRTECIVTTPQGDMHVAPPVIICYRGKVLGEEHSNVFLSVSGGEVLCSILRENGTTYIFGPEKNSGEPGAHMMIAEKELLATAPFTPFDCIADDIHQPHVPVPVEEILAHGSKDGIQTTLDNGKLLQTDIAVEADSQFYGAIGGDVSKTLAYIGEIFSMSSMIYEDEANLTHHLTWVKVWTTSDPYQVHGNAYALEDTVKKYWQLHYTTVQRDLAHIMTSISNGGGGFGYYSLCDNANSYSVSSPQTGHTYPTFAFTYDVYIISHEIGHNFTLIHTHDCYWNPPLDTCYTKDDPNLSLADACFSKPITPRKSPGTIMSYCANANYILSNKDFSQYKLEMTFSHRPDSVMRYNAEKAACIVPPAQPKVILLSPRGSESYTGGATILLKWTYANIQNVTLEYSTNGGTSWQPIQSGIAASLATLNWQMPNVSSQKMLVRIYDTQQQTTGDTSLLFFTLIKNIVESNGAEDDLFMLSPNPANDHITVSAKQNIGQVQCDLIDELGVIRKEVKGNIIVGQGLTLDTKGLAAGKYFLRVKSMTGLERILAVVIEGR
jgi:hypothetical protein